MVQCRCKCCRSMHHIRLGNSLQSYKYSSILHHFLVILTLNNIVTLKSRLRSYKVIGHDLTDSIRVPILLCCIVFEIKRDLGPKMPFFSYLFHLTCTITKNPLYKLPMSINYYTVQKYCRKVQPFGVGPRTLQTDRETVGFATT